MPVPMGVPVRRAGSGFMGRLFAPLPGTVKSKVLVAGGPPVTDADGLLAASVAGVWFGESQFEFAFATVWMDRGDSIGGERCDNDAYA
jgi:hypothetical protein